MEQCIHGHRGVGWLLVDLVVQVPTHGLAVKGIAAQHLPCEFKIA